MVVVNLCGGGKTPSLSQKNFLFVDEIEASHEVLGHMEEVFRKHVRFIDLGKITRSIVASTQLHSFLCFIFPYRMADEAI